MSFSVLMEFRGGRSVYVGTISGISAIPSLSKYSLSFYSITCVKFDRPTGLEYFFKVFEISSGSLLAARIINSGTFF